MQQPGVVRAAFFAAVALVALSAARAYSAPANDFIASSAGLQFDASSPYYAVDISTAGASLEAGEPQPCGDIGATLWYRFEVADHPWNLEIDSGGSDFDTVLAVYRATGFPYFPDGLTQLGCNDLPGAPAILNVALEPHTWYMVQAGGAHAATGRLNIKMVCEPACAPLSDAMGRYEVPGPAPNNPVIALDVNTSGATTDPGESAPCGNIGRTVWYSFTSPPEGIAVDATGSDFDVVVAVYLVPQTGPAGMTEIACAMTSGAAAPRVHFDAGGSGQYLVQLGGVDGTGGNAHIEISCDPAPCPPYGNNVWAPLSVVAPAELPRTSVMDTTNATNDDGEPTACGAMSHTVWFQLSSVEPTNVRISTDGSSYDTAIALYQIDFGGLQPPQPRDWPAAACVPGSNGARASLQVHMTGDEKLVHWYLQIGSRDGRGGELNVQFDRGDGTVTIGATLTPPASSITMTAAAGAPVDATPTPGPRWSGTIRPPDTGSCGCPFPRALR